ncbi:alpha/beta hydrolase [Sphingomonas sp. GCM10030256]|uniref:alpha/beta hydrolase n=1 Tax=Sphingomonas sp. GCM10030256 TaxID=3273427 RepID=UPI00361DADD7
MVTNDLAPAPAALQQTRAPRPLPLFLHHVAEVGRTEPELAARALAGLRRYADADAGEPRPARPVIARHGAASVRDCGGDGPPVLLIPSLINPPDVLDLDADTSLAAALARSGSRALLLDWGDASARAALDVSGHVEHLLLPAIKGLDQLPALLGYCLGGTMALAAAQLTAVRKVATLASPWRFRAYPGSARAQLVSLLERAAPTAQQIGLLPMEVLQSAFWSLDTHRIVAKFAAFAAMEAGSAEANRFVRLESWANGGEPLPFPAAAQLIHGFFRDDQPSRGEWQVGGQRISSASPVPNLHLLADGDLIAPAAAAPPGPTLAARTGHVGLVLGQTARRTLHPKLFRWLLDG